MIYKKIRYPCHPRETNLKKIIEKIVTQQIKNSLDEESNYIANGNEGHYSKTGIRAKFPMKQKQL